VPTHYAGVRTVARATTARGDYCWRRQLRGKKWSRVNCSRVSEQQKWPL